MTCAADHHHHPGARHRPGLPAAQASRPAAAAGHRARPGDTELAQYVNDRPYAASSMLAVALKEAFGTALAGRCDARPELAAGVLPLEIDVSLPRPPAPVAPGPGRPAGRRADLIAVTRLLAVATGDPGSVAAGTAWWQELTAAGGEGMVVKPAANLSRGPSGLVQPGLKVRGREYLRLIYGPDYTEPANLARLRQRGLEALGRVARGEALWRVHECVFAVLALESEPVDRAAPVTGPVAGPVTGSGGTMAS